MTDRNDIEYKGNTTRPGNPLWDEYLDKRTGKSTLQIHNLKKISNWDKCKHQGSWEILDPLGNLQCSKCGLGYKIVWGIEIVKDGKIIKLEKNRLQIKANL